MRNQRTLRFQKKFFVIIDCIIAHKLPMLKQGVKTSNAEFIRTRTLSQISFVQLRHYVSSFLLGLLSLTVMPKSKKTLETSLDLTPLFKTSVRPDARVEGLVSNVDYLKNLRRAFIQKKYGKKRRLPSTRISFSGQWFFFLHGLFTPLITKGKKKRINKAVSKQLNSFCYFLCFGLKDWVSKLNLRLSFELR